MINLVLDLLPRALSHPLAEALRRGAASRQNARFYCRALAGESRYNICINADLTVSCNCQDFDGSGQIGDLNTQTLAEIFDGPVARSFRETLASGNFPVPVCVHCAELMTAAATESDPPRQSLRLPHLGIMVENSALCNLRCQMCDREKLTRLRKGRLTLSLQATEKVALLLSETGMESLYFFNLGEPFLPGEVLEQITIIRRHNPGIRIITSTNGLLLDRADALEAALLMDYIYVSLDGISQEMVTRYQVGGDFAKAHRNLRNLCEMKRRRGEKTPIVEWKYLLFRWNDTPAAIRKALQLAADAAVDLIAFYPGSTPRWNSSFRMRHHPYFKTLGAPLNGAIVVNLENIPRHLLSP